VYDKESSCLVLYPDLCKTKLVVIVALNFFEQREKLKRLLACATSTPTVPGRSSNVEHRGHRKKWCGPGL
jgi:hypothetical protein